MLCKKLDEVHELIDWTRPEKLLAGVHANRTGEKTWPPLMMFKALLLQSWYRLSDPGLEKQLARDLLFRRLIGRDLSESVAAQSTLWRFRQKLEGGSLLERLRPEQLAGQGVYIKSREVSIVDASVIAAKQSRPKQGKDRQNTQDPEASWSVEGGSDGKRKSTDGYKAHDNVSAAYADSAYQAASSGRTDIDRWAKKINNLTGYPQAREAPWSMCLVYSSNPRG